MAIKYRTKEKHNPDGQRLDYEATIESELTVLHLQLFRGDKFIVEGAHRFINENESGDEVIEKSIPFDPEKNSFTYDEVIQFHPQAKTIVDGFLSLLDAVFKVKLDIDQNFGLTSTAYEKVVESEEESEE